jgi:predicted NBD/HSP70 family sugar kinase
MSENERRILALIAEEGPLTKGDLSMKGEMAWATVVKYVNRLQELGVLIRTGTAPREPQLGKNSYLFDLAEDAPKFVGVDIEYRTTRLAIVTLRREVLWQTVFTTEALSTPEEYIEFLGSQVLSRVRESGICETSPSESPFGSIAGIGIGMPRWLLPDGGDVFPFLSEKLTQAYSLPVRVDNNIRAYTLYKEPRILESDFIVVSVRNGIGAGLVMGGALYRGDDGLAGEIGHITAEEGGKLCRCGKHGCLETVVNQFTLFDSYQAKTRRPHIDDALAVEEGLPELFERAADGEPEALAVLAEAAEPLCRSLATLLLVLNVRNLYLVGHFGEFGDVWLDYLREAIRKHVDPRLGFDLHYCKLEDEGYLLGAALLVAREYVDYSVLGNGSQDREHHVERQEAGA